MKKNNIYDIVANTISILKEKVNLMIFALATIFFSGLFAFFYGFVMIPMPGGVLGFYRMEPPTSFEIAYMIFSIVASALIVAITIHATRMKMSGGGKGKGVSSAGLATGIFGAVCPACLGINFLAFGNVFTAQLSFLIPYIFWIQIGGIIGLTAGLYLVAKNAYSKECVSCSVDDGEGKERKEEQNNEINNKTLMAILLIAVFIFAYQVATVFGGNSQDNLKSQGESLVTEKGEKINIDEIVELVTPKAGFTTQVKWGNVVAKMVETGSLDPVKLEDILAKRYGQEMKPEWRAVLAGQDANLSIDNENAVFMMYVLWVLAKHNENAILVDSPFAKYFTNYDIGVGRAGYGDTKLLALTPQQQAVAKRVAENAYRPCCGNSTAAPDCSHGYSALGLAQLMASQGFSEDEIFKTFVQFNSFWFPETYIKNALYFKIVKGINWNDVDKKLVAGAEYSTLKGSFTAKNYLKENFGI